MPKLLIIADDLTGATDTGVQFAKKGVPVFVATEIGINLAEWVNDFEVLAVNTGSRHLAAAEAAERVRTIVGWGREAGIEYFYKKTDSTLRGNIGSELEALLHASGNGVLAFVPASPKLQRTTREGFQFVGNRLLQESAFSRDPLDPITDSYIPAIIGKQTRVVTTSVFQIIKLTHDVLIKLRFTRRIAVAGLNPHAGENGAFGIEDADEIEPAVAQARERGIDAHGPFPPDTVFMQTLKGQYDAVVCMYHDQGHIPMKLLDFEGGVNVTLGLPIIRTSVDHGTAFDIAYKGVAFTRSLSDACKMATKLSKNDR